MIVLWFNTQEVLQHLWTYHIFFSEVYTGLMLEQALEFVREQCTWENEDQETKSVKVT